MGSVTERQGTLVNPNPRTVFPWKFITKAWYWDHNEVPITVNTGANIAMFVLNDIYACSPGQKSLGYTNLGYIYNTWKVHAVDVFIRVANKTTTDTIIYTWLNDASTNFSLEAARSYPNFQERYIMSNTGSGNYRTIKYHSKAVDTLDFNTCTSTGFCGTFSGNVSPTQKWYMGIGLIAADYNGTTGSAVDVILDVKITQHLMAYDLLNFVQ